MTAPMTLAQAHARWVQAKKAWNERGEYLRPDKSEASFRAALSELREAEAMLMEQKPLLSGASLDEAVRMLQTLETDVYGQPVDANVLKATLEAALLAVPQEPQGDQVIEIDEDGKVHYPPPAPAPISAEALERRIARIASRACTGQQGESQIEYEIEELLKDALAAAPAQGQTLDVNALREAFDAGFWAWPNANEPERIALREAWIMRCVAAQGQTERLR